MNKEHVIRGNAAIIRCLIPSFVADFVDVVSWHTDQEDVYYPGTDYGSFIRVQQLLRMNYVHFINNINTTHLEIFNFQFYFASWQYTQNNNNEWLYFHQHQLSESQFQFIFLNVLLLIIWAKIYLYKNAAEHEIERWTNKSKCIINMNVFI